MTPRGIIIVLIVVLILFGFGGFAPEFGYWHHANNGWGPTGGIGVIALVLLLLLLFGAI